MNPKSLKRLRNGFLGGLGLALLTALVCVSLGAREGDGPAIAVLASLGGLVGLVIGFIGVNLD